MAKLLTRETQRALLERLHSYYPAPIAIRELAEISDTESIAVNLAYLAEHGLVTADVRASGFAQTITVANAKITARGIDFLADDGGLGAILGVTVVRLHTDTVRELLIARVQASDEPMTTKERLIDQIRATPALAFGQIVQRALDAGLDAMPNAVDWLQQNL